MQQAFSSAETAVLASENETGFYQLSFEEFTFALKRYTFSGQPFGDRILEAISPDLNLDWNSLKDDWDPVLKDKYAYNFKN